MIYEEEESSTHASSGGGSVHQNLVAEFNSQNGSPNSEDQAGNAATITLNEEELRNFENANGIVSGKSTV